MNDYQKLGAELRVRVVDAGLGPYADVIESNLVPAVGLRSRLATDADLEVGASRFGGEPDVPDSFEWPAPVADPVVLVAQIRLADVAPFDRDRLLPEDGLLSIFAEISGWPAHVRYFAPGTALARRSLPRDSVQFLQGPHSIRFRASGVEVLPHLHFAESVEWPTDGPISAHEAADRYDDLRCAHMSELFPGSDPVVGGQGLVPGTPAVHQLLGKLPSDASYADTSESEAIDPSMRVLLGFDSDCLVGMEFGDFQRVWLLIDEAALARRDFTRIRCAL